MSTEPFGGKEADSVIHSDRAFLTGKEEGGGWGSRGGGRAGWAGGITRGQKGEASQANENEKSQLWTLWKSCW